MENTTILFGNGLNRLNHDGISWQEILLSLMGTEKFEYNALPLSMVFERLLMSRAKLSNAWYSHEINIKNAIARMLNKLPSNDIYDLMVSLGFKNYITTNYDYSLKNKFVDRGFISQHITKNNKNTLVGHTAIKNEFGHEVCKIWNIHGEITAPDTIILGLDNYCKSVSQINSHLRGRDGGYRSFEAKPMKRKIKEREFDSTAWVDLFFSTNIHIIGLNLDYSEVDIWWLLNQRIRLLSYNTGKIKSHNKIFYHALNIDNEKEELLKSFNVIPVKAEIDITEINWKTYYEQTLKKISLNNW